MSADERTFEQERVFPQWEYHSPSAWEQKGQAAIKIQPVIVLTSTLYCLTWYPHKPNTGLLALCWPNICPTLTIKKRNHGRGKTKELQWQLYLVNKVIGFRVVTRGLPGSLKLMVRKEILESSPPLIIGQFNKLCPILPHCVHHIILNPILTRKTHSYFFAVDSCLVCSLTSVFPLHIQRSTRDTSWIIQHLTIPH